MKNSGPRTGPDVDQENFEIRGPDRTRTNKILRPADWTGRGPTKMLRPARSADTIDQFKLAELIQRCGSLEQASNGVDRDESMNLIQKYNGGVGISNIKNLSFLLAKMTNLLFSQNFTLC